MDGVGGYANLVGGHMDGVVETILKMLGWHLNGVGSYNNMLGCHRDGIGGHVDRIG